MDDVKQVMRDKTADQMTDDELEAAVRVTDVYAARWGRDNEHLTANVVNPFIGQGVQYRREIWRRGTREDFVQAQQDRW